MLCSVKLSLCFRHYILYISTDTPAGPDDRISSLVGPHQFTTSDNHLVSITVSRGDYHSLMKRLVTELEAAGAHVANSNQKEMIAKYVSSFSTGSVVDHEDASRYWIKDKGPCRWDVSHMTLM